jgi:hypothetical protein
MSGIMDDEICCVTDGREEQDGIDNTFKMDCKLLSLACSCCTDYYFGDQDCGKGPP